jgi:hypothetical protein
MAVLAISIMILAAYNADAQDGADNAAGRYTMSEVEGGYLRLDTANGRVSFCHRERGDWICELVADDRAAYEAEIGQLARENRRLKDDLAALQGGDKDDRNVIVLPNREDVDRLMAFLDQMMRRFFDMVKSLSEERRKERTGSSEPAPWLASILPPEPAHNRCR